MQITILPRKKRFPILLFLSAIFSIWLAWSLFAPHDDLPQTGLGNIIFRATILTIAFSSTAIAAMNYFYTEWNPNAMLLINNEGINDKLTIYSVGFVKWNEVHSVETRVIWGINVLLINLKNPDLIVSRQAKWKRRQLRRLIKKLRTPMVVSQHIIDYDIKELSKQINTRLEDRYKIDANRVAGDEEKKLH